MGKNKSGRNWREQDAQAALAEISRRGESVASYERRTGVPSGRVFWWRQRLAQGGGAAATALQLLPVRVADGASAVAANSGRAFAFEVTVGNHVVRVPVDFDEVAFERLARTLGRVAC